jgi:hypothetical protein
MRRKAAGQGRSAVEMIGEDSAEREKGRSRSRRRRGEGDLLRGGERRQFYLDTVCPPVNQTATQLTVRYGTQILDRAIQRTQYFPCAYLRCYFLLPCTFFDILNIHRNIDLKLYVLPCLSSS